MTWHGWRGATRALLVLGLLVGVPAAQGKPVGQAGSASGPAWSQATNAMCPILPDEPVDPGQFTDYEGRRVFFCCGKCRRKFMSSPEAYVEALAAVTVPGAGPGDEEDHASGESAHEDGHDHDPDEQHHAAVPEGAGGHDHASGHGDPHGIARLVRWVGKLHPVVIHFPIALILSAAMVALLERLRGRPTLRETVRFCVLLGAAGAVVSASLGWAAAAFAGYPEGMAGDLLRHRWFGTGTALWLLMTAVSGEVARRPGQERWQVRSRVMLFTGALLVGVTGHLGATLVYGAGYYTW